MVADPPAVAGADRAPVPLLVHDSERLRKELATARVDGVSVGFVPTMGALHEGHESLIRRSVADTDLTVVSIFVNPLQFGPSEDLVSYPRSLEADLLVAAGAGAGLVFAPGVRDVWPDGPPATSVSVAGLRDTLEGAVRPGHFDGVATVVAALCSLVGPCRAYFGEKDFQQLIVVRRLVRDLLLPVEVVACPTVRAGDGLACSSRNSRLSAPERTAAAVLGRALQAAARLVDTGELRVSELVHAVETLVADESLVDLDYAEVVDPTTLARLRRVAPGARLLVAARVGRTRLIDNLALGAGMHDAAPSTGASGVAG